MPILSLDHPIDESFSTVKALDPGHPVYLLVAEDDSHIVIKKEGTQDADNLRRNQLAMQLASPQARSVILSGAELLALKRYIDFQKMHARFGGSELTADVKGLKKDLASTGTWFKMREAKGLTNLKAVARMALEGDKSGARALAKSLNRSGGLEALGRIVGADLFNQNGDRFLPGYATPTIIEYGTGTEQVFKCKALVNVGNVMAALSDGKLKVIGLDSWDPAGEHLDEAKLTKGVSALSWNGALLAPDKKAKRLQFAEDICHDLELLMGPRNRRFSFLQQTRLDSDAPQRIVSGMESIRKRLIDKMVASMKRPNPPAGLASRLAILRGH